MSNDQFWRAAINTITRQIFKKYGGFEDVLNIATSQIALENWHKSMLKTQREEFAKILEDQYHGAVLDLVETTGRGTGNSCKHKCGRIPGAQKVPGRNGYKDKRYCRQCEYYFPLRLCILKDKNGALICLCCGKRLRSVRADKTS